MSSKPKILVLIDWYLPGYKAGGPIRSVANIVTALGSEFDFSIVTTDRDWGESQPYPGIKTDAWTVGPNGERVMYLSPTNVRKGIRNALKNEVFDTVYMNSLFSMHFTIVPLMVLRGTRCRKVVAPRGMLGAGALALKSGKKKLFLSASKALGLFKDVTWHASTTQEGDEIAAQFGAGVSVVTALNIAANQQHQPAQRTKEAGSVKLFFLSRVSPKKNLHHTLEILASMNLEGAHVVLDIFGPIEDEAYQAQCDEHIAALPHNVAVSWKGAIPNHELANHISNHHFMVLPTLHENYGHAILEALSMGCPVLVSDQTPWRDLQTKNSGWDIALNDPIGWQTALQAAISCDQATFDAMSAAALAHATEFAGNEVVIDQTRQLFVNA